MLYPQNGDRIVTIDSVTSLRPMCRRGEWRRSCTLRLFIAVLRLTQRHAADTTDIRPERRCSRGAGPRRAAAAGVDY